jgi:hypothetical protein
MMITVQGWFKFMMLRSEHIKRQAYELYFYAQRESGKALQNCLFGLDPDQKSWLRKAFSKSFLKKTILFKRKNFSNAFNSL